MAHSHPLSTEELLSHAGWVRELARSLARDAQGAEDLAQETLGVALARPPAADRPLGPWLARVLVNLAGKRRRTQARRRDRERRAARPESSPAADELLASMEEQQRLAGLVAALDEPYRSVVLRRYYKGESCAAIARSQGLPQATVRSQLARGLARLRARLEARCDGDRQRALGLLALAAGSHPEGPTGGLPITALLAMKTSSQLIAVTLTVATLTVGGLYLFSLRGAGRAVHPDPSATPALAAAQPAAVDVAPTTAGGAPAVSERVAAPQAREPVAASAPATPAAAAEGPPVVIVRAIDRSGLPLAGAQLLSTDESWMPLDAPPSARSGADGVVELSLTRAGWFQYMGHEEGNAHLCLRAPGHANVYFVGRVTLNGRRDQGDRELAPGGSLAGSVVGPDGLALEDVTVIAGSALVDGDPAARGQAGPDIAGGRPTARAGAGGLFELSGVHLGPARLWARAPGHAWACSDPVQVRAGEVAGGIALVLRPLGEEARITGRVVDADGLPVQGARVSYYNTRDYEEHSLTTQAGGRFAIDATATGEYAVAASDPAGRHGPARSRILAGGQTDLVFELTPLRHLALRAQDAQGLPLEGVSAMAKIPDVREEYLDQRWAHSDAEGRVQVTARAAAFEVYLSLAGFERLTLGPFHPDDLPTGEVVAQLVRMPVLRGWVLDGDRPVPGARVELAYDRQRSSSTVHKGFPQRLSTFNGDPVQSDAEGRFELPIEGDERGIPVLLVAKQGFAMCERILPAFLPDEEPAEVELQLTRGGQLTGRVLLPPDRTPESVVVGISRGDGYPLFTRIDGAGRYHFEHLAAGDWRIEDREEEPEGRVLSMAQPGEAPFDWNCQVIEGQTTHHDLDLRWQEDLRVHGSLRIDGRGAQGWSAVLEVDRFADREFKLQPAQLAADGRFAAEARPVTAELVLRSPPEAGPARRLRRRIRVVEGLQPCALSLETGALSGRVAEAPARLRLYLRVDPQTHFEVEFESDAEGAYRIEGVPAGELSLQHWKIGEHGPGWYGLGSVVVRAGETTQVD